MTATEHQRYVLAHFFVRARQPLFACAHPNGRKGLRFSSVRKPLEFSKADLVVIAPRLELLGGEFRAIQVEHVRVIATDEAYKKRLGINFRVFHVGNGDFRHAPLLTALGSEHIPSLRCLHPASFLLNKRLDRT